MHKISVCIPVYNVERYIEKCARSLFEQTLDDIEYIFVDDCSQDRSIDNLRRVLIEYPHRQQNVKIIQHKSNLKVSAARQTAINAATGKYVIMCDSDDYIDPNMYETLYQVAECNHADIVYCDMIVVSNRSKQYISQEDVCSGIDAVQKILQAKINSGLVIKLVRKSLYQETVSFSDIRPMYDDTIASIYLLYPAKSIVHVPKGYYNYIIHQESICRTTNPAVALRRAEDVIYNSDKIIRFIKSLPTPNQNQLLPALYDYLFKVKWHLLNWWAMDKKELSNWRDLWPELMINLSIIHHSQWKKIIYRGISNQWTAPILLILLSIYKKIR